MGKRQARTITYNGKTQTLADWAIDRRCSSQVLRNRLNSGWPIEEVLFGPVRESKRNAFKARFQRLHQEINRTLRAFAAEIDELGKQR